MTREEILEKSRNENKVMDERERDIQLRAANTAKGVGLALTTILVAINTLTDGDSALNLALYGLYFSITAAEHLILAFRLKKAYHWVLGILFAFISAAEFFYWWKLRL